MLPCVLPASYLFSCILKKVSVRKSFLLLPPSPSPSLLQTESNNTANLDTRIASQQNLLFKRDYMTIMHRTSPKATDKKERKNNNKTKVNYVFLVVNSSFCNDLENSIKKKKRVREIKNSC